ncbi:hypothetical protein EBR96_10740 [bacterium]|nr:hypothetical protein [bacterium]
MILSFQVQSPYRVKHTHHMRLTMDSHDITLLLQITHGRILDMRWIGSLSETQANKLDLRLLPGLGMLSEDIDPIFAFSPGWKKTWTEGKIPLEIDRAT